MNGGTTSTLDASAQYDDQGLYFSIILGIALTVLFCPFVLYLSSTSTLWLKRLYRPNHTIEPPLAAALSGGTSAGGPPSPRSPLSPRAGVEDMGTPSAAAPVVRSSHGRRKRMGISLPYTSSFYQLPSWHDWWSVEESVPHLESALAEPSVRSSANASASAGTPNGDHAQDVGISDGAGDMLSPGSIDYRQVAGSHVFAPLSQGAGVTTPRQRKQLSPLVGASGGGGGVLGDERTPLSHRGDAERGRWEEAGHHGDARGAQDKATRVSYGTVPVATRDDTAAMADALPRTPLDPQVALYVFTLKYFLTFLLVGCGFVSWICWIASSDDAFEWMLLRNDPHRCGKQGANETACLLLQPYCAFLGSDIGCTAVPLPGLYDLTVKNIRPRSELWWWVGLLNMGFVASFIVITLYFVQTADVYITKVMKMQMSAAMGYRVACVCGLGEQKKRARRQFESLYLSPEAYFPPNTAPDVQQQHASPLAVRATPKTRSVSEALQETVYRRLYCPGMSCLFSIARVHVYQTTIDQLVFAKPGRVKAILFTRKSPEGMYTAINAAEGAIANLQEAIAQQNALTRRKRYHERERSLAASYRPSAEVAGPRSPRSRATGEVEAEPAFVIISSTAHDEAHSNRGGEGALGGPVLYQYVNCCHKVSAVPYREDVFRKEGERLNTLLEEVPKQPATGAVFIEFTNSRSAFEFVNMFEARYGGVSSRASALIAGPPGHIIESNLNVDKFILALRFILLLGLYVLLLLTWSIPVGFLGSLDNIALVLGPAFRSWLYNDMPASLRSLAVAYLPVIVLALFNVLLPFLIRFIVIAMGAVNKSECDGGHLYLQYVFMVLTAVVFQAALQGSLAEIPNLIENMGTDQIVDLLVSCVTPQSGYWYAKVITSTALSTWLDLVDPIALLQAIFFRNRARVQRRYDAIFRPTEFQYPRLYSFDIMILSIGVLFHMTAPLLVPFVALFFVVRYLTQRAKLYDRYRPSFAAPHDCTDFGISAQVMRAVITLLCFAEMCGLFVMSLKKHTGGMMMCSATLAASLVLAVYIYVQTRTWITTLGNARRFFPGEVYTSPAAAAAAAAETGSTTNVREGPFSSRASSPTAVSPAVAPRDTGHLTAQAVEEVAEVEGERQSEDDGGWSDDSSLRTFSDASVSPGTPVMSEHASTPDRDNETSDTNPEARSRRHRHRHRRQRTHMLLEDDVMDEYENLRVLPSISGRSTNPFIGHLLPRKPGLRHLYQPKHQRLAVIDVDKEVNAMMDTEFVVERYWDRGMTWFEADAVEGQEGGAPPSPRSPRPLASGRYVPRSGQPSPAARSASESSVASTSHTATYTAPATALINRSVCETESVRDVGEETDLPSSPPGLQQATQEKDGQLDEL